MSVYKQSLFILCFIEQLHWTIIGKKAIKNILSLLIFLGTFSCSETEDYNALLEGQWIYLPSASDERPSGFRKSLDEGLTFTKGELLTIRNMGRYLEGSYTTSKDTVYVKGFGGKITKYLIQKLTQDTLCLKSEDGDSETLYSRNLEYNPSLNFDSIELRAGWCLGDCPEFFLRMDRDGKLEFTGTYNVLLEGKTSFKSERTNEIIELFKWSYIDQLDTTKAYSGDDGWGMDLNFHYNSGESRSINSTYSKTPFRLKKIINTLLEELRSKELIK